MRLFLALVLVIFQSLLLTDSNAKRIEKRWAIDEWPSMGEGWMKFGEEFKKRADSMREWMRDRHRNRISNFSPIRPITESIDEKNPQEFDPSVVIVNKGEEEERPNPSTDFRPEIPFPLGFDRPQFWSFGDLFSRHTPWWKGPNICVERRVIEGKETSNNKNNGLEVQDDAVAISMNFQSNGNSMHRSISLQSTQCTESDTSYTCVSKILRGRENRTTIVKYQCCHGFKRNANNGCTQVDLKDLVQTMKDLKSNRMLGLIERLGFTEKLVKENITVFGLTDDSLIEYEDDNNRIENEVEPEVISGPSVVRRRRELVNSMTEMISMHMIPGFVRSGDLDDEHLLSTLSPSKRMIRINVYNNPNRVVTANCAPIISPNNYATNGVVHIIDRVMQSPTKTIGQMIENDSRFTILKSLLANTDLMAKLQDKEQHLTLFAPTNDAFLRLDQLYLERLLKGQSCVQQLLNNHIIKSTLCSTAIRDYASVKNGLNLLVPIKRVDENLEIDGIRVLQTDLLATNGVLHVIDGVLNSERSQPISKYLERHGMKEYLNLIKESGILEEWDALENVSFFIPSIASMRTLSTQRSQEIRNNSKEMIGYHVLKPKTESCDWNSDQIMRSIDGNSIRVNVFNDIPGFGFRSVSTAQCAKIVEPNEEICGANVHIVDQFLVPTNRNMTQVLDSMENLSLVRQIIKNSGIQAELADGVYTLLAPNDHTIRSHFTPNSINTLLTIQSESEKFIRNHLLPEIICCSGVNSSPFLLSTQQIRSLDGSLISAHKSINGRVRFGSARVTQCDLMATNGVIHIINRVMEKKPFLSGIPFPFEIIF